MYFSFYSHELNINTILIITEEIHCFCAWGLPTWLFMYYYSCRYLVYKTKIFLSGNGNFFFHLMCFPLIFLFDRSVGCRDVSVVKSTDTFKKDLSSVPSTLRGQLKLLVSPVLSSASVSIHTRQSIIYVNTK